MNGSPNFCRFLQAAGSPSYCLKLVLSYVPCIATTRICHCYPRILEPYRRPDHISIAHFMGLSFLDTNDFEPQVFYFHLPHYLYPSELSLSR